jgi:hypothetical protein
MKDTILGEDRDRGRTSATLASKNCIGERPVSKIRGMRVRDHATDGTEHCPDRRQSLTFDSDIGPQGTKP